ncbi:MAG: cytochrome c oxidase subunit II [Sphingomonas sp.]
MTPPPRQSALAPFGAEALATLDMTVVLTVGACVLFLIVALLFALALRAPGGRLTHDQGMRLVLIAGAAIPTLLLAGLLLYALPKMRPLPVPGDALAIAVSGEQFWWRVVYRAPGAPALETANEVRVPVGRTVVLSLASPDVIHSFWVPGLAGKMDMIPGRANRLVVRAEKAGRYRGQCAEFCGLSHALMAFDVVAMPPAAFDAWLATQAALPPRPGASARPGMAAFARHGCGACHAIRGTPHDAAIGPDLTRFGARATVAAGILPNTAGNAARFIRNAPAIKPGARMPAYPAMPPADAAAIARYLVALK